MTLSRVFIRGPVDHRLRPLTAAPEDPSLGHPEHVAAEADNTRRTSASAWRRFEQWANDRDHQALPAAPETITLYLGHLTAEGMSIASVDLAPAAISHFRASAVIQNSDNPGRRPAVAEAIRGWRSGASAPTQADAPTNEALARIREILRVPRRGRGGKMETPEGVRQRATMDLAMIGVLADGCLRRSEAAALTSGDVELWPDGTGRITIQKGTNQPDPRRSQSPAPQPGP